MEKVTAGRVHVPESLLGCVKEAGRLMRSYALSFLIFTAATAIPLSILSVLRTSFLVHPIGLEDDFDDGHEVVSLWPSILTFEEVRSMQPLKLEFSLGALHCMLGQSVFFIQLATISMTVASVYRQASNLDITLESLNSLPKAFGRNMIVTALWIFLISKASDIVLTGLLSIPGILPFFDHLQEMNLILDIGINMVAKVLPLAIMLMFLEFAFCASVVEEGVYGRAALARSCALTAGNRLKVLALTTSFLFLYMLPRMIPLIFTRDHISVSTAIQFPDMGSYPNGEATFAINRQPPLWGLQLCLNALVMPTVFTFNMLVRVLFYFSCKSSHDNATSTDKEEEHWPLFRSARMD